MLCIYFILHFHDRTLTSLIGNKKEYLISDTVNNKTLVSDYVYGTDVSIWDFLHFQYLIDFKLKIFDPFRFGNIKIDEIAVLKLSLG